MSMSIDVEWRIMSDKNLLDKKMLDKNLLDKNLLHILF